MMIPLTWYPSQDLLQQCRDIDESFVDNCLQLGSLSQKNVSEIPENRAEPYLSSKLSINNHHALQPPDHEEVVWLWPSIGPDDRVDMLIWAGWCPEETVKVDRSQTCSPCPSLTYSASDCSDLDRLEESLNTKHMHGEDPASTEISDRPPFATKSYRSSSDNQKTGYSIRASSRDRDDDDSGGRDGCPAPEGSREAERMVVGDEEHKVACPFRKHNPLRFNIREYHWCAAKPLNSFAELRVHLKKYHSSIHPSAMDRSHHVQCLGCGDQSEGVGGQGNIPHEFMVQIEQECSSADPSWERVYRILFPGATSVPDEAFEDAVELNEVACRFHETFDALDASMRSVTENCIHGTQRQQTVDVIIEDVLTGMKNAFQCYVMDTLSGSYLFKESIDQFFGCGSRNPFELQVDSTSHTNFPCTTDIGDLHRQIEHKAHPAQDAWLDCDTPSTVVFTPSDPGSARQADDEGVAHREVFDSSDIEDDDMLDDLVSKITDIVLEHLGCAEDGNFQATVRMVESAAEGFLSELLNEITTKSLRSPYTEHRGSDTYSEHSQDPGGNSGNMGGFSQQGTGMGEGGSSGDRSGESGNQRRNRGDKDDPGGPGDGHLELDALGGGSGGWSCPYRKQNPARFNPVDFHACATQIWKSFHLFKRHIRTKHLRIGHEPEQRYRCQRCKKGFPDENLLNLHMMEEVCPFVLPKSEAELDPEDGITPRMESLLIARDDSSKIASWHSLWLAIFPGDPPWTIPSPAFVPPDEIEEIQRGFRDSETILEGKLGSLLRSILPAQHHGLLPDMTEGTMEIIREHIDVQLNTRKSSQRSTVSQNINRPHASKRTNNGGVKKRRAGFPDRSSTTGAKYARMGEAAMAPPRTLLPAQQTPLAMRPVPSNIATSFSTWVAPQNQQLTALDSTSEDGGHPGAQQDIIGGLDISQLMTALQPSTHTGNTAMQRCLFCQGPCPCTCLWTVG